MTKDTSGDLLSCEIKVELDSAYVGQPVHATLDISVRQYRERGYGELDANSMWKLLDPRATSKGMFEDADWQRIHYREETKKNEQDLSEKYYVYSIKTTLYPTKAGPFDVGPVAVAYNYPKKLRRDLFGRLQLADSRRLRARAKTPRLEIKPIPTKGRPADFNGAIGPHTIVTRARPTDVPVGDPITLTLEISGEGPLERLGAPRLDQVRSLTDDFEISDESLAGEIQRAGKIFSQTIRALREDVAEIPPIPFSYFDPKAGRFKTAYSDPISINVTPAERLALTALSESGGLAPVLVPLVETTEGLLANYTDPEELLAVQSAGLNSGVICLLAGMPAVFLLTWFVQRRAARYRDDEAWRRRNRAYANARKALRNAAEVSSPGQIHNALLGYIADRCNVPTGGLTRIDAVKLMADRGAREDTVRAIDHLLVSLELAQYGGKETDALKDGAVSAKRLVGALERQKLK